MSASANDDTANRNAHLADYYNFEGEILYPDFIQFVISTISLHIRKQTFLNIYSIVSRQRK